MTAGLCAAVGFLVASLLIGIGQSPLARSLTAFYESKSYLAAHGRNIVNVILVDFRVLDTLGEITVVVLAAWAGIALIRNPKARPATQSVILKNATRFMVGMILVFAVYLLLRGHHEPGGGFIAALVAGPGFALFAIAEGPGKVHRADRVRPAAIAFSGLGLAIIAGLVGLMFAADRKTLFVHVMFLEDVEKARDEIKNGLERRILEVTRR